MPTFDPFRESWLECSNCRKLLFEKHSINEIPQRCPYCGVDLKYIIIDKSATKVRIDAGEIETIREEKKWKEFQE